MQLYSYNNIYICIIITVQYYIMKNFETNFIGWTLITAAVFLLGGKLLSTHHIQEYVVISDFKAINENFWYWVWMYRIHIFGWVIMAIGIIGLNSLFSNSPYRILVNTGSTVLVVGTFTIALAVAFYYSFGALGVGKTIGKSELEIQTFMNNIYGVNHYVTCLVRFGRVFSGLGMVLLGVGLLKSKLIHKWIGLYSILFGLTAMGVIMLIPDNFDIYKPLFYIKVLWLTALGVSILFNDIKK